ncbi:MAG: response regulator [Bacteroidetes bacterium]|nr:response regulator [Bacteroidota bacterium]
MIKKKVLVVDDTEPNRLLLGALLASHGVAVVYAEDTDDAFETFASELPDMVIMDQILPGGLGSDTINRMRKLRPSFVAVITSALTDPADIQRIIGSCGAEAFLPRPVSTDDIQALLRRQKFIV